MLLAISCSPITNSDLNEPKNALEKYSSKKQAYWKMNAILDYGLVIYLDVLILLMIEFW
jgi:hypothetical protein